MYDNFSLGQNTEITDVHWRGSYDREVFKTITGFTIGFWEDNAGQPGNLISSQLIPGTANETFVGFEIGIDPALPLPIYDYWLDLTQPELVLANTETWLSIVADLDYQDTGIPPVENGAWGWHVGTGGDGMSVQDFDDFPFDGILDPAEGRLVLQTDMAFSLTAIPEPASIAIWLMIVTGAVYVQVRRKSRCA